jgi:hypothetical protein
MTLRLIFGAVIGGVVGFGFYRIVGCSTGSCPLASNPWLSTLYGATAGALIAGTGR